MKVLLVTDLEGVAGVDRVEDLLEGSPGFARAQGLLGAEIAAAVTGLRAGPAGVDQIVISDSHRGGPSPTVLARDLPAGVTLHRSHDAYDPALFADIGAVACLGMHAAEAGFVGHTVDLTCMWEGPDGRPISETDLVFGLAAAAGVPGIFVAGDEALAIDGIPTVATKRGTSSVAALSRDPREVVKAIKRAARGPLQALPGLPGPLSIRFRSRWMAEMAERAGAERRDETRVNLVGDSLAAQMAMGVRVIRATGATLSGACRPWALSEDVAALAGRSFTRVTPPSRESEARRVLHSFLSQTEARDVWTCGLRALILHMLEGHAPGFFAREGLAPFLAAAVAALKEFPADFPLDLAEDEGMARLDGHYVLHERGEPTRFSADELTAYVGALVKRNLVFGWLLAEIARQMGVPVSLPALAARPYRRTDRRIDLYWATHLVLLESHYLRRPLGAGWEQVAEELLLGADFALRGGFLDLAGEIAICLVAVGEDRAPERARILAALSERQEPDGSVIDEADAKSPDPRRRYRMRAHCSGVALLALATAS